MAFRSKLALFLSLIFGLIAGEATANPFREETRFNFEVKIVLTDGTAEFIGSRVWQIHAWRDHTPFLDFYGTPSAVRGEAVPIEVPSVGVVYFLKRGRNDPSTEAYGDFPTRCPGPGMRSEDAIKQLSNFISPCEIRKASPLFVTAEKDAPVVKEVIIPWVGEGPCAPVCLASIAISRTDQELSVGLVQALPWLSLSQDLNAEIGTAHANWLESGYAKHPPFYRMDFSTEF